MAEEPKVIINIRTVADDAATKSVADGVSKVDEASKKAEASLHQTGKAATDTAAKTSKAAKETAAATEAAAEGVEEMVSSSGDSLDKLFAQTKKLVQDTREKLMANAAQAGESGEAAGDAFKSAVEGKTKGIVWTQDTLSAATKAWEVGTIIGQELGKALAYYADNGSLDGFLDVWLEGLAAKVGIMTATWEVNLKALADTTQQSLRQSREDFDQWLAGVNKSPTEDSITWLERLRDQADQANEALRETQQLQKIIQRGQMDKIGQDEADQIEGIDASKMPESQKIKERQRVKNEAEQKRLENRNQERSRQRQESFQGTLNQKDDWVDKQRIEEAQKQRAITWTEMRDQARANATDKDGKVDETVAKQNFDNIAKQRGITDMSYGDDEQKKYEAAKKAREEAEKALEETQRRHDALRKRLSVEEQIDNENTRRNIQRDSGKSSRISDDQAQQEFQKIADEKARREEKAAKEEAAAERKRQAEEKRQQAEAKKEAQQKGNDELGVAVAGLKDLQGMTPNEAAKEQLAAIIKSFTDRDGATLADLSQAMESLKQIKTGNAQASQLLAQITRAMAEAMGAMANDLKSVKAEVENLKTRSRQ